MFVSTTLNTTSFLTWQSRKIQNRLSRKPSPGTSQNKLQKKRPQIKSFPISCGCWDIGKFSDSWRTFFENTARAAHSSQPTSNGREGGMRITFIIRFSLLELRWRQLIAKRVHSYGKANYGRCINLSSELLNARKGRE